MKNILKHLFVALFTVGIVYALPLHAQPPGRAWSAPTYSGSMLKLHELKFEHLTVDHGLSQNTGNVLLQDYKGFLWIGTQDGLNRYDGYGFKIFRHDPLDENSLSDNFISSMRQDKSGIIWIGTNGRGLNKFDPEKEKFIHYKNDPNNSNSLSHNIVNAIYEDPDEAGRTIWIGTNMGLNKFNRENETFTRFLNDTINLANNAVLSIYEDSNGELWIGTRDGGLNKFDREKQEFTRYVNDPNDPNSLGANFVSAIYEDSNEELWIGTRGGGFHKFDREKQKFTQFINDPANSNSLSINNVSIIYESLDKRDLWIGTSGGGLNKFDRDKQAFIRYLHNPNNLHSLNNNYIFSVIEDESGTLWIGTGGGGINKFDKRRWKFLHYKTDPSNPNSLSENLVWAIEEDRDGDIWIGTQGGGIARMIRSHSDPVRLGFTHYRNIPSDPTSLSSNHVRAIHESRNGPAGTIWIATTRGLNRLNKKTGKFKSYFFNPSDPKSISGNFVRTIHEDKNGALWLGIVNRGLNKFDIQKEEFTRYLNDPNDENSLSSNIVYAILEDRLGMIWIGTGGGGLNRLDPQKGLFTRYQHDSSNPNSLSHPRVLSIYEDPDEAQKILWIGTPGGLNKFNRATETFTHYTQQDGLPNDVIYGTVPDDHGNFWISTNKGLSKFNPRTEKFKNFDVDDGLQSNEFNTGAYLKTRAGEMMFGGINGFNIFHPDSVESNPHIPSIVVTDLKIFNKSVLVTEQKSITATKEITLSYKDNVISFEYAALNYTNPMKNQYAYQLEGFNEDWLYVGNKRDVTYTNLDPGEYIFRVKGSNDDGVWNEQGTSIKITITPPFWQTFWFRTLLAFFAVGFSYLWYSRNLTNTRMKTELQTAHDAQMSIMPQTEPQLKDFDISGICIPANEVGGDFFDYIWLNEEKTKLGIAVGDVSGKAMKAAMTAVMCNGMIHSKATEVNSVKEIMTRVNHPVYLKTERTMFTALFLASVDILTKELTFTNAGLNEPLLKSNDSVTFLKTPNPNLPLGGLKDTVYKEAKLQLKSGDLLIFYTDGVPEAQNRAKAFYELDALKSLIENIETSTLSAKEIKNKIIEDLKQFTGSAPQHDDMTVVVIKLT